MAPTATRSDPFIAASPSGSVEKQGSRTAGNTSGNLFGAGNSTQQDTIGQQEVDCSTSYLEPSAFSSKDLAQWSKSGRTAGIAVSPVAGEIASYTTYQVSSSCNVEHHSTQSTDNTPMSTKLSSADKAIYFASPHTFSEEVINFYAETYTLFTSLQRIVASSYKITLDDVGLNGVDRVLGPPNAETIGHMSRVTLLYLDEVAKLRETVEVGRNADPCRSNRRSH